MYVNKDTEIVIEGFAGSANSFAVTAFQMAQLRPVKIAHHTHQSSQIIFAAKENIPALVLVRQPERAVLSTILRSPFLPQIRQSPVPVFKGTLKRYIFFYENVMPYRDRCVVADFNSVTHDFGMIIRQINSKYGTSFIEFEHTKENVDRCFALMDQNTLDKFQESRTKGILSPEMTFPRPTKAREEISKEFEKVFQDNTLNTLIANATLLYNLMRSKNKS